MKQRLLYSIYIAMLCSVFFGSIHVHAAPQLANYFLRWDIRNSDVDPLSRYDVLVLDIEVQFKTPGQLMELRRKNPDVILIAYITPQEILKQASSADSVVRRTLASGIQDSWYLRDSSGNKLSYWPGTYLLDVTDPGTLNSPGWPRYLVNFVEDTVIKSNLWDGVFYDNAWEGISWFTSDIDANGDGKKDTNIDAAWKNGMEFIYSQTRNVSPSDFIIIGNGHTSGYQDQLNGKLIEQFQIHDWERTMNIYAGNIARGKKPNISILNVNTLNTGNDRNYKLMRYGLTSSLLEDGYYSFDFGDQDHGQTWWYDEYDINLGTALGTASAQNGFDEYKRDVWQRNFSNGISVVNSTNQPQTIALGGEFEKITGTQDRIANDGAIVSSLTLPAQDGRILLKTTASLDDVIFTNGDFARFFTADGARVRNGYFVFDDAERGGTQIARIDMDGNGTPEIITVQGPRVQIYRDNGDLYMKAYPYTANYKGDIRIAIGDLDNNGFSELFVAPGSGNTLPIKVYARHGTQIKRDWYPFGEGYSGGYSLAVGALSGPFRNNLVIGAGTGSKPYVNIYDWKYSKTGDWFAYETTFTGGVFVATGDIDGDGVDEVVTGPGVGKEPLIRTFEADGSLSTEFIAYSSFLKDGIIVRTADVDFDGVDDIVGLSNGVGF